jgi:hypothetical protein
MSGPSAFSSIASGNPESHRFVSGTSFAVSLVMTRILSILLTGVASGIAVWWFRNQQQSLRMVPVERGEVIYRNAPLAGTGE